MPHAISQLTVLGGATLAGFYAGRLARLLRLPSLIGYMFLGVLLGPSLFDVLDQAALEHLGFVTEIALGLVAFSIGAELHLGSLRRLGYGIVSIIFAESLAAFFAVLGAIYLLTDNLPMALIFAAVAPASAPAGTVAVIQEYRAKGSLTQALYAVVGFDDGLAIVIFGLAAALAKNLLLDAAVGSSADLLSSMAGPCLEILESVVVGVVLGFFFCLLVRRLEQGAELLVMILGTVLLATGVAAQFHLSLILTNMVIGFVLVNTRREELTHRTTRALQQVMLFLFILFFCLAGAHLRVQELGRLGLVGVVYIFARSAGLIGGSRLGARLGRVEARIKNWIGLGILSQAGVAIGLSLIIQQEFGELATRHAAAFAALTATRPELDPMTIGASVITTITATCIVFEIIGPILTKVALTKAGEIGKAN